MKIFVGIFPDRFSATGHPSPTLKSSSLFRKVSRAQTHSSAVFPNMNPSQCYSKHSILFLLLLIFCSSSTGTQFRFPEYDYMPSTKNVSKIIYQTCQIIFFSHGQENAFKEYEMACEQSPKCENEDGISRTNCIRECVSPSCYKEIYSFDEVRPNWPDVSKNPETHSQNLKGSIWSFSAWRRWGRRTIDIVQGMF